jgi:hypothetical protein
MKACGRTLPGGDKCGTLFEGTGSYCRVCRNAYMRDYHKARKQAPLDAPRAELPGVSCQCCSGALRNNTINRVTIGDDEVTLCSTCAAVYKYMTSELNETQADFLMGLVVDTNAGTLSQPSVTVQPTPVYVPQVLAPGNRVACGACDDLAEEGKEYCKRHAHWAEAEEEIVGSHHVDQ